MSALSKPGSASPDDELSLLRSFRRRLHSTPEVGLQLPKTQREILDALADLGLDISVGSTLTSIIAVVRGTAPRSSTNGRNFAGEPVVLLRADMDALPIIEESGVDFAATNGSMHACGHDLHIAGLVGAARNLVARRDDIPGTVVLMFQPGEEGHGGGRRMIDEGVLDVGGSRPLAAYAIHVDSRLAFGQFTTRPGPLMAGVSGLRVRIEGTGGHAAAPHLAVDPVPVAAECILAVQSFVSRRVAPHDPVVVSIGRIASDSVAGNILASQVDFEANLRHFSEASHTLLRDDLPQVIRGIAHAHGCEAVIEFVPSYPAVVNDAREVDHAIRTIRSACGEDSFSTMSEPAMTSEDFAYILEQVPGAFVFLGARPEDLDEDSASPMHSATVRFDDRVLQRQATILADLAVSRLQKSSQTTQGGQI
ncbi:MAG: M20 metallopeptidase family protein [Brevibacterium sp.]